MIASVLRFLKAEKSYVILFLVLAATYIVIDRYAPLEEPSPAAAEALKDLEQSESRIKADLKDMESIEKYLRENPDIAGILVGISLVGAGLFSLGIFVNIGLLFNSRWRKNLSVSSDLGERTDWKISMLFKVVVLFMAFSFAIQLILALLHLRFGFIPRNFLLLFQTTLADFFVLYAMVYIVRQHGGRPRELGFRIPSKNAFKEIFSGLLGYAAVFPLFMTMLIIIVFAAKFLSYEPPAHPLVNIILEEEHRYPFIIIYSVILATVIAPILEEVFFRGFCYPIFKKKMGRGWAAVITSLFFAAIHDNAFAFVPIFILGMGLSYIYEKRGSLIAPITLHLVHNSIFILYFFLAKKALTLGS